MKILFTGGGTGGHIYPIIAVSRELRSLAGDRALILHYVGPNDEYNLLLLRQEGFVIHTVAGGKLRRYISFGNIVDVLFKIPFSFLQSFFLLLLIRPQLVFSKGGTGSLPITFWARVFGRPIFIHESDTMPGLSNKITGKWARKIFTSFEKTPYFDLAKTACVGNPTRKELLDGTLEGAKETLGLSLQKPIVLFWGGSLGAQILNEFVTAWLNDFLKKYEIVHVCGKNNYITVQSETATVLDKELEPYYHLYESLNEVQLKHALAAASVVVSRSGSGSIFEIAAAGKPSILVPLPGAAQDHQSKNAYAYAESGAAVIIEQANLSPNLLMSKIDIMIANPAQMKQAALAFAKPLAAAAVAREMLEYLAKP